MMLESEKPGSTVLSLSGPIGCTVGRGSHEMTGSAPRRQSSITWSLG